MQLRSRFRAAGVHVLISAALLAVPLYLIVIAWYPGFHFLVDGGWQGVRLMAAIDLVLGPLLTFIVFDVRKARRLIVLDLSLIGALQFGAMAWGIYAIHSQQPVAISFHDGIFYSVTAEPLEIEHAPAGLLASLSDRAPALVYVRAPANADEEARAAMQEVMGVVAAHEDPLFFQPFTPNWGAAAARAQAAPARAKESRAFAAALPDFLAAHGGGEAGYRWFPYQGRYGRCTLAFTTAGELLDALGCELD